MLRIVDKYVCTEEFHAVLAFFEQVHTCLVCVYVCVCVPISEFSVGFLPPVTANNAAVNTMSGEDRRAPHGGLDGGCQGPLLGGLSGEDRRTPHDRLDGDCEGPLPRGFSGEDRRTG